jgi:SAM-dependent methyltransferase
VPHLVGTSVLELGCGPGHLLRDLIEAGYQAIGVDRSPAMWRRAQRRLRRAGYSNTVIAADARALPFADRAFDSLVMTFPSPVIRDVRLWEEAARVLRPDGRFVVVLGARWRPLPPFSSPSRGGRSDASERAAATSGVNSELAERAGIAIPPTRFHLRAFYETSRDGGVELIVAERLNPARDGDA